MEDQRAIFVTGVVGRAMGSGVFKPDQILQLTLAANRAYDALITTIQGGELPPEPSETSVPFNDDVSDVGNYEPEPPPY